MELAAGAASQAPPASQEAVLIAEITRPGAGPLPAVALHVTSETTVLSDQPQGYISIIVVSAEAEGQGVARALLAAAEAWARRQGLGHLALEVFAGNTRARGVYHRAGYREETLKLVKPL